MQTSPTRTLPRRERETQVARRLHARRTLALAALFFAAGQAALSLGVECWWPELRDPLYGQKLGQLRRRLIESAGPCGTAEGGCATSRLVVMLGSSRTVHGCDAAGYQAHARAGGRPAIVFNFGIPGGGPLTELLTLRRLLGEGIRPNEVLIELLPALFVDEAMRHEAYGYPPDRLWFDELLLVARHGGAAQSGFQGVCEWSSDFCCPAYAHRLPIKRRFWPDLLPLAGHEHLFAAFDGHGWSPIPDAMRTPDVFERGLKVAEQSYAERLGRLNVEPLARAAIDDLLALCRQNEILATLVVLPEGPNFRRWYSVTAAAEVDRYLAELATRHGVALIDARPWCAEESFIDSHHLLASGARDFSRRLAETTLRMAGGRSRERPAKNAATMWLTTQPLKAR